MQVTNDNIDQLLGPGEHNYDQMRYNLAQWCLRINGGHTLTNLQSSHLDSLMLMSNGKLLMKGNRFMYQMLKA